MQNDTAPACRFGDAPLTIEDVVALAQRQRTAVLNEDPAFRARISRGADFLDRLLREDGVVYGVTTSMKQNISLESIFRGIYPFLVATGVCTGLLFLFPAIVTWLPDCM